MAAGNVKKPQEIANMNTENPRSKVRGKARGKNGEKRLTPS
jgi:hypothetical protein